MQGPGVSGGFAASCNRVCRHCRARPAKVAVVEGRLALCRGRPRDYGFLWPLQRLRWPAQSQGEPHRAQQQPDDQRATVCEDWHHLTGRKDRDRSPPLSIIFVHRALPTATPAHNCCQRAASWLVVTVGICRDSRPLTVHQWDRPYSSQPNSIRLTLAKGMMTDTPSPASAISPSRERPQS